MSELSKRKLPRFLWRLASLVALLLPLGLAGSVSADSRADFPIAGGWFYKEANGRSGQGEAGFSVTDADGILFFREFVRRCGPEALGYPATRRFVLDGFVSQGTQKAGMQWRPELGAVAFLNVFDILHDRGLDSWLETERQVPPPFDASPDSGLPFAQVMARHLQFLDGSPAIRQAFLSDPDWLDLYGLPVSFADYPSVYVVRAQRAVFQQWKADVPWARAGQVTIANGMDVAKDAGILPQEALLPEAEPSPSDVLPGALIALEQFATSRFTVPYSGECRDTTPAGTVCYRIVDVKPDRVEAILGRAQTNGGRVILEKQPDGSWAVTQESGSL